MTLQLLENQRPNQKIDSSSFNKKARQLQSPSREKVKQELRYRINRMLMYAQDLDPDACVLTIREQLQDIQRYCTSIGKSFIVAEESITCNQYDLGGSDVDAGTLFRGPDERATVAICVTRRGSLLHRNDSDWKVYRNAGDVSSS